MSAEAAFAFWPQLRAAVQPKPLARRNGKWSFNARDEWSQLVQRVERGEFRLRAPAASSRGLCGPIVGYGPCLDPVFVDGDTYWVDPSMPAEDGDFVMIQWDAAKLAGIIERGSRKAEWLAEYGSNPDDTAIKLLRRFGNDYWTVTRRSMLPLGESHWGGADRVLGVVRYVERRGVPIYGCGPLVAHCIDPNAATKTFVSTIAGPGSHNSGSSGDVTINVPAQDGDHTAIVTITGDFVEGGSAAATQPTLDAKQRHSPGPGGDTLAGNSVEVLNGGAIAGSYERLTVQGQFSAVAGQAYFYGYYWSNDDAVNNPINWRNVQIQVVLVFR